MRTTSVGSVILTSSRTPNRRMKLAVSLLTHFAESNGRGGRLRTKGWHDEDVHHSINADSFGCPHCSIDGPDTHGHWRRARVRGTQPATVIRKTPVGVAASLLYRLRL